MQKVSRQRSESGSYLIELLVALAISGFLAVALASSLSEQMRASSSTERQAKAAQLAQETLERFRQTTQSLPPYGTYPIQVNSDDGVTVGPYWFQSRPLSVDHTALNYPGYLGSTTSNGVQSVIATLSPGVTSSTSLITVTVTWTEGTASKSAAFATTLSKTPTTSETGIHL